jgi:hypothetical protein
MKVGEPGSLQMKRWDAEKDFGSWELVVAAKKMRLKHEVQILGCGEFCVEELMLFERKIGEFLDSGFRVEGFSSVIRPRPHSDGVYLVHHALLVRRA